jgi:hypothetical protein
MSLGLGFPKHAGGPMQYADSLGRSKVLELKERHARIGALYLFRPTSG